MLLHTLCIKGMPLFLSYVYIYLIIVLFYRSSLKDLAVCLTSVANLSLYSGHWRLWLAFLMHNQARYDNTCDRCGEQILRTKLSCFILS